MMCNSNNKIKHTFCNNNLARPFLCTLFVLAAFNCITSQSSYPLDHLPRRLLWEFGNFIANSSVANQMIHRESTLHLHIRCLFFLNKQQNNDRNCSHGILQNSWLSIGY